MRIAPLGRVLLIVPAIVVTAEAAEPQVVLKHVQQLIDEENYSQAIATLEKNLPNARGNEQFLTLLRRAYRAEIRRLVQEDRRRDAEKLLERLRLIESPGNVPSADDASHAPSRSVPDQSVTLIVPEREGQPQVPPQEPRWRTAKQPVLRKRTADHGASDVASVRASAEPPGPLVSAKPLRQTASPITAAALEAQALIKKADSLFLVRGFAHAGQLYDQANRLAPEQLEPAKERWAYCRLARAVDRIGRGPLDNQQWIAIKQEVQSVSEVIPSHEFTRSLLAMADQHTGPATLAKSSSEPVIRANEPDRSGSGEPNLLTGLAARIGLSCSEGAGRRSLWQRFRSGSWYVLETSNFRVHATDENLAGQVADVAECTRIELYRTWYGQTPESNWSPKCEVYVHDSPEQYARITRQGPGSPGHSQTGVDRGRVSSRRVDLRRDGQDLVRAILPHEITHVVLADRFSSKPMPRWADEGMAVLTEPVEKKQAHLRNLRDLAPRSRLFTARQLMTMGDYPSGDRWPMFYAQSVSLVEFLVNRSGPTKFVEFMERSLTHGYENELKRVYNFASFEELDRQWSAGRLEQVAAATGTPRQ